MAGAQTSFKMPSNRHAILRALLQFFGGMISREQVMTVLLTYGIDRVDDASLDARLKMLAQSLLSEIS